jgi:hypothetical protein
MEHQVRSSKTNEYTINKSQYTNNTQYQIPKQRLHCSGIVILELYIVCNLLIVYCDLGEHATCVMRYCVSYNAITHNAPCAQHPASAQRIPHTALRFRLWVGVGSREWSSVFGLGLAKSLRGHESARSNLNFNRLLRRFE